MARPCALLGNPLLQRTATVLAQKGQPAVQRMRPALRESRDGLSGFQNVNHNPDALIAQVGGIIEFAGVAWAMGSQPSAHHLDLVADVEPLDPAGHREPGPARNGLPIFLVVNLCDRHDGGGHLTWLERGQRILRRLAGRDGLLLQHATQVDRPWFSPDEIADIIGGKTLSVLVVVGGSKGECRQPERRDRQVVSLPEAGRQPGQKSPCSCSQENRPSQRYLPIHDHPCRRGQGHGNQGRMPERVGQQPADRWAGHRCRGRGRHAGSLFGRHRRFRKTEFALLHVGRRTLFQFRGLCRHRCFLVLLGRLLVRAEEHRRSASGWSPFARCRRPGKARPHR